MTNGGIAGGTVAAALGVAMLVAAGPLAAQETDTPHDGAGAAIHVELNRLDSNGNACQPYLVFENKAEYALSDLRLDLVLFDADGIVADRMAINAAPLPAGKTSLIVFEVDSMPCESVGRILINDVIACAGGPATAEECLDLLTTATRVDVPLFK